MSERIKPFYSKNWRIYYRIIVHSAVLLGIIANVLYMSFFDTSEFRYFGIILIFFYFAAIFLDMNRDALIKNIDLNFATIIIISPFIFLSIIIAFIVYKLSIGLIPFLFIQGFIWLSSCGILDKTINYEEIKSKDALKLRYDHFINRTKNFINVGMLMIVGVGFAMILPSLSEEIILTENLPIIYLLFFGAYLSGLLVFGILIPIDRLKEEIIFRIAEIDKEIM